MIATAFTRPWEIRTPGLTRYLEAVYVDEFFNAGKLRISSFKVFRRHPDEQRNDPSEGIAIQEIISPNARHSILGINGQEAYVLCCGTVESKDMVASSGTDAGFRIKNSLGFADAVSRQIPGFIGGSEGLCHYRDSTLLRKYDERAFRPPDNHPSPEAWAKNTIATWASTAKTASSLNRIDTPNKANTALSGSLLDKNVTTLTSSVPTLAGFARD